MFFQTFYELSSRGFGQKCHFLKNEKKMSKIFKNRRFFVHMGAQSLQCQPPEFEGPLLEDFRKVQEQKQRPPKFGFKGVPLYIQIIWTHF